MPARVRRVRTEHMMQARAMRQMASTLLQGQEWAGLNAEESAGGKGTASQQNRRVPSNLHRPPQGSVNRHVIQHSSPRQGSGGEAKCPHLQALTGNSDVFEAMYSLPGCPTSTTKMPGHGHLSLDVQKRRGKVARAAQHRTGLHEKAVSPQKMLQSHPHQHQPHADCHVEESLSCDADRQQVLWIIGGHDAAVHQTSRDVAAFSIANATATSDEPPAFLYLTRVTHAFLHQIAHHGQVQVLPRGAAGSRLHACKVAGSGRLGCKACVACVCVSMGVNRGRAALHATQGEVIDQPGRHSAQPRAGSRRWRQPPAPQSRWRQTCGSVDRHCVPVPYA